jgi:uncharacterized protein YfaS (alpha-2-macroglobulin family)
MESDAKKYKPGDTATIMIKSPYDEATALVTIERELVLEHKIINVKGSTPTIKIPIKEKHLPNIFVSVVLLKGRTEFGKFSEKKVDLGKPSFKIGYINLPVDTGTRKLNVEVKPNKSNFLPQEEVDLNIKVYDYRKKGVKAELTVAVVDLGVLNLINYKTPNAFDQFYGPRELYVRNSELRRIVIGERKYEEGEKGGGGKELAILFRKEFKATAYYNPSIITKDDGTAKVKFKVPDNLTSFRIMVIANTKESLFGSGEEKITVSKPLMIQPALPRFVRLYDKFSAGVVVHNYTKKDGEVTVKVSVKDINLTSENTKKIFVKNNESKEVRFNFSVDRIGKPEFTFSAILYEYTDGVKVKIPMSMPRPTETVALYESTIDKAKQEIIIPEDVEKDVGGIDFSVSSTSFVDLKDGLVYLLDYPYLCLEQRISKILPIILAKELLLRYDLINLSAEEMNDVVNFHLSKFKEYQNADGSFSYWPGTIPSVYITTHAVFTMIKAKEKGFKINEEVLKKAIEYLKDSIGKDTPPQWGYPYSTNPWLCIKAYIAYVLSLLNQGNQGYISSLFEKLNDLPLFGKAYLLKAIHHEKMNEKMKQVVIDSLTNKIMVSPTTAHFEEHKLDGMYWLHNTNEITTAVILQSLIEVGEDFPMKERIVRWLLTQRKNGRWRSTHENMYVFYALCEYLLKYEKERPDFIATIKTEEKEILKAMFKGFEQKVITKQIKLNEFKPGEKVPLDISIEGKGRLYYTIRMNYLPKGYLKPRDEGIAIEKVIETLDGKRVNFDELKAGEKYIITLKVITPQERNFVVVNDPLPAGLEVVNEKFSTESEELKRKLYEKREKQNEFYWWAGFNYSEIYDDFVLIFADTLLKGEYTYSYMVRATTSGKFSLPPAKVEEMYSPEVFGRSAQTEVEVK